MNDIPNFTTHCIRQIYSEIAAEVPDGAKVVEVGSWFGNWRSL